MGATFALLIITCLVGDPKSCETDVVAENLTPMECVAISQPTAASFFSMMAEGRYVKQVICTHFVNVPKYMGHEI